MVELSVPKNLHRASVTAKRVKNSALGNFHGNARMQPEDVGSGSGHDGLREDHSRAWESWRGLPIIQGTY